MKTQIVNIKKSEYDIYIGRPSKWGNPFIIGRDGNREEVIEKYTRWLITQDHLLNTLHEIKGKRLGCFCKPHACHGDILVRYAEKFCK